MIVQWESCYLLVPRKLGKVIGIAHEMNLLASSGIDNNEKQNDSRSDLKSSFKTVHIIISGRYIYVFGDRVVYKLKSLCRRVKLH